MNHSLGQQAFSRGKKEWHMSELADKPHVTVNFTIDGRPFSTDQPDQTVIALLTLAGLDPQSYDLGEIRPHQPEPKVFEDADHVHIHEGEKFVSIRERAEVA